MTEEKSRAELVLEFIKTFLWPVLIVLAAVWFGPDLKEILKNRTWKIGVVEVGDRISNLKDSMQDSLLAQQDYLAKIKDNAANPEKVKELADAAALDIGNTQRGVKKEIQNIQDVIPQKPIMAADESTTKASPNKGQVSPTNAREWELLGFKYILGRDVNDAIEAFAEAEKDWPNYHNVAEIRRELVRNRQTLAANDSPKWKEFYQHLLKELSWGMPADVRQQINNYLGQS
jgi:hypothetical protein